MDDNVYISVYPNSFSLGEGLFKELSMIADIPWYALSNDDKDSLERAYCLRSGVKKISSQFLEISKEERAYSIFSVYKSKWKKYWALFELEYDPLSAYIVEESGNKAETDGLTRTTTYGRVDTTSSTDTGTVNTANTVQSDSDSYVYGFNSVGSVPTDSSDSNETTSDIETRNLSANRTTTASGSDSIKDMNLLDSEYSVSKKGNIGYATPQKLLTGEFELWSTPFFNMVFSDIDKMIMLKVY